MLERQLLNKVKSGDQKAFTELFEHYQTMVYDYSIRLTRSKIHAEEIVQNIFLKIWMNRGNLEAIENFGAYLNRATRNECFTALKKIAAAVGRQEELTEQVIAKGVNTDHRLLYNESAKMLRTAVNTLPPQRKLVYELCHEQGLKYDEVAEKLNISSGTVHTHMKLALKTIRMYFSRMEALILFLILFFI